MSARPARTATDFADHTDRDHCAGPTGGAATRAVPGPRVKSSGAGKRGNGNAEPASSPGDFPKDAPGSSDARHNQVGSVTPADVADNTCDNPRGVLERPSNMTRAKAMTSNTAPPPSDAAAAQPGQPRKWVPRLVAYITYLAGFGNIASAISPGFRHSRVHSLSVKVPTEVQNLAAAATLMSGVLLVLIAHALKRRKKRAWWVAVVLLITVVVFHLVRSFRGEDRDAATHYLGIQIFLTIVVLVLLLVYREEFYALGDPYTRWRALRAFVLLAAFSFASGMALMYWQSKHIDGDPSAWTRLQHVALGLMGIDGPVNFKRGSTDDLVAALLGGLGLMTALIVAYLVLRPAEPIARQSAQDDERLRELIAKQGRRDSLAYFATHRDKSVIWSPSGKAAITYRVVSGVMLASGDPIGDPEAWPGAIKVYVEEADRHAWVVAVVGCSETGGEVWCREADLDALELGDEAICYADKFSLEGRAMRNVRQMVNRVERQGYECQVRRLKDIPRSEVELIKTGIEAWRGSSERGSFSMALGPDRFGDPSDGECVVATATKDREVRALINFVPWGTDGMSLDLMVRDREAEPGLNELLIVKAMQATKELGITRASLNFAVFRSALERGEKLGAGPITRMWRSTLVFFSRWYQIESLYKFNSKFQPEWVPRFVAFKNTRDIPRVGLAYAEAEGFIVPPGLPWSKKDRDERELDDNDDGGVDAECPDKDEDCPGAGADGGADRGADTGAGRGPDAGAGREQRRVPEPEAAVGGPGGRKAANG
ncbi:phosphatidylglycerol lysyltransferase domain-containing protein [Catenulispora pinistramenti]|uniref:phosphatidylglycerol lysyltransferase domain-containing protein n=1 Tax=Catenulispora pinistramenti TaxID=2705254 RepID=UPI002E78011E|nr:phosphatidylglycerol lysyltransferase domain-containing protein [Catenulispora pinistramenti]